MSSITALSISSLEHAAMMEVAKSVWLSRFTHEASTTIEDLSKPFKIDNSIPLPNILVNRLNVYLDTLGKEIDRWVINHGVRIFPDRENSYMWPCLTRLVWRIDGTIDYESTAKALLEMDYLTELEKFEIAKGYFFIDYIHEKWPELSDDSIKQCVEPEKVFEIVLDASYRLSKEDLIVIHKKFEYFVKWYFVNFGRIVGFKISRMAPFLNTDHEARVRIILHGLGYGVPLPA